ncbi:MAG: replicative DNA helicase [Clostridia bacterium]|nr:replicative DNA helicase [Clostridia bacterium]
MDANRIPPHDVEAEQAVLGSMLVDKDAVIAGLEVLREEDFYREDDKAVFAAISSLYSKSEPVDLITVKKELTENGSFERIGGMEFIASLPGKVPTTTNVDRYIKIVEEQSMRRKLIQTSNELISLGYDDTEETERIIDLAEKRVMDLSQNSSNTGYSSIKDVLVSTFDELEKLFNQKGKISGITTGFVGIDRMTSGLHNSDLNIIAARPAMGKSAFAINIATNAAKSGIPTVIFNLEMSKEQVVNRILASEAMVDSNKLRTGQLDDNDWMKLASASGILSEAPIYIDDTPGISIMEIRTKCRKLKMERDIGLVVIDYLQLVTASGKKNASREQEISEISRSLKILAKELNVPVIALSQLSRSAEKRQDDKRPMLSDLRESGAIEQDADIVMFIYREDYYNPDTPEKNVAEIIFAKHRGGSTGTVKLSWLGNYTKFLDIAPDSIVTG